MLNAYEDDGEITSALEAVIHSFIVIDDYIEESDFDIIIITDNL